MKDIKIIKVDKWMPIRVWLLLMLFVALYIVDARAETKTVTAQYLKNYSFTPGGIAAGPLDLHRLNFYYAGYNSLYSVVVYGHGKLSYSGDAGSTSFTVSAGGSGTGTFTYSKANDKLYWFFSSDTLFTNSYITLTYGDNSVPTSITQVGQFNWDVGQAGATAENPVLIADANGFALGANGVSMGYTTFATLVVSNTYTYTTTSLPSGTMYNITISKAGAALNTKWQFYNNSNVIYFVENTFNKNTFSQSVIYNDGLYLNMTVSTGDYKQIAIAGAPTPAPTVTVNPVTGSGIMFDKENYTVNKIATISYLTSTSWFSWLYDYNIKISDGTIIKEYHNLLENGSLQYQFSKKGSYKATFYKTLLSDTEIGSDSATVYQYDSYIFVNNSVPVGKQFNITYRWGFTPSGIGLCCWITTKFWDFGGWVKEGAFVTTGTTANTNYNSSIILKKEGKYLIELEDVYNGGVVASAVTYSIFTGQNPVQNIQNSFINITDSSTVYSFGDYISYELGVDNSNYTYGEIVVEAYNWDRGINSTVIYVQDQTEQHLEYISERYFAGTNSLRLMMKNNSATTILAFKNFTLSQVDSAGYGLSIDNMKPCTTNIVTISAITPSTAWVNISYDDAVKKTTYNINGSKKIPVKFSMSGTVYITLNVNGESKKTLIVEVQQCAEPITTPSTPEELSQETTIGIIDGWVGLMGYGVNDITKFGFAIFVIIIFFLIGWILAKETGATVTALLPFGFFVFITYIPVWFVVVFVISIGLKTGWFR